MASIVPQILVLIRSGFGLEGQSFCPVPARLQWQECLTHRDVEWVTRFEGTAVSEGSIAKVGLIVISRLHSQVSPVDVTVHTQNREIYAEWFPKTS